jgi:probable phosphoglycerate mutase
MVMKPYFARPGESEANVLREISNRGLKHPLTEKGRQQAQTLAAVLQPAGIAAIYTSPLLRAVQTAEILSEALGVGLEVTDALREYDCGILEGTSGPETWAAFWALREAWWPGRQWDRRIEGGESFLDMQARFVPFIEGLLARDNQGNECNLA